MVNYVNYKKLIVLCIMACFFMLFLCPQSAFASDSNLVKNSDELTDKDVKIKTPVAIVIDADTGTVLYNKDGDKQIYPASTTKILTAIIAIENSKMTDKIKVSQNAMKGQENNGTHMGLHPGEILTMKDALYGMILESANDAAIAIAEHTDGSEEGFKKMLNDKIKDLGLTDTHFVTPNGLFDKEHYTTAYDMAKITQYAMGNAEFRKLFGTNKYILAKTNKRKKKLDIYTTNKMAPFKSEAYEYYIGGKNGYIDESKCTLATAAKKDDMTLIAYFAKAASPYDICAETKKVLNKCFETFKEDTLKKDKDGNSLKDMLSDCDYIWNKSVPENDEMKVTIPINATTSDIEFDLEEYDLDYPVSKGTITGKIIAKNGENIVGSTNIVAHEKITKSGKILSIAIKVILAIIALAILLLIWRIIHVRQKFKRKASRNFRYRGKH